MKKYLLLFLFVSLVGFSQDCKFEKNEIDPFSKTKVVNTKKRVIVDLISSSVVFQFLYNIEPFIKIEFTLSTSEETFVNTNNKVMFLLSNDEVLNFNINEEQTGKRKEYIGKYLTEFNFTFPISTDKLNKIKLLGIKKIRFETKDKTYDFDVKNQKDIAKINSIIDCFLNEIDKK